MNIILTDIANITPFIIPIVPPDLQINSNGANESENTLNGKINVMDNCELRIVSWSSIFPVNKNYDFVNTGSISNGWAYVAFLELMKRFRLPIRIIITTKTKVPVLNMLASIDEFTNSVDKAGDINYTLKLKEFPENFFNFIDRDKEVFKYVKKYIQSSDKLKKLKNNGLISAKRSLKL